MERSVSSQETYEQIVVDCVRYFGMYDINQIGRLTPYEFDLLRTGRRLAEMDKEREYHVQAYLNREINRTEVRGKKEMYVYQTFRDFYDVEKEMGSSQKVQYVENDELLNLVLKANS